MPTWLIIILVVAAIGGIIGFIGSEDGSRKEGAATGAVYGALGCGVTGNEKYSNIGNGTAAKNVTSVQHNW